MRLLIIPLNNVIVLHISSLLAEVFPYALREITRAKSLGIPINDIAVPYFAGPPP